MALRCRYNKAVTGVTVLSLEKSGCHSPWCYAIVLLIFVTIPAAAPDRTAVKRYTCKKLEKCVFINEPSPPQKKTLNYKYSVSLHTHTAVKYSHSFAISADLPTLASLAGVMTGNVVIMQQGVWSSISCKLQLLIHSKVTSLTSLTAA